jgi:4-carboxymuconolactone decarboxylase
MARVPTFQSRTELPADAHAAWDEIAGSRGHVVGPFTVLLHSPELARRVAHLGAYVRFESTLPADVRELVILGLAQAMRCEFEWAAHVPIARKAGVREEAITAIRERRLDRLTDAERDIVGYVIALIEDKRVDEQMFRQLERRFGVDGVVELTASAGYYAMLACVLNAFEVEPDAGAERLR